MEREPSKRGRGVGWVRERGSRKGPAGLERDLEKKGRKELGVGRK